MYSNFNNGYYPIIVEIFIYLCEGTGHQVTNSDSIFFYLYRKYKKNYYFIYQLNNPTPRL